MPKIRAFLNLLLLGWALCAGLTAALVHAQESNVELLGMLGGQIMGGAKACGINPERIRKAGEKVLLLVQAKARSAAERRNATQLFNASKAEGVGDMRPDRETCAGVHVQLSEIEVKLAAFPDPDANAAASLSARPVPPLGELRPDIAQKTARP